VGGGRRLVRRPPRRPPRSSGPLGPRRADLRRRVLVLWLDGKKAGEGPVGAWRASTRALFVGAQPDSKSRPQDFATGLVDEVRLSDVVRYAGPFDPPRRDLPDASTLLLPFDVEGDAGLLDASGRAVPTAAVGALQVVEARR
jgi:hypothetical protein